MSDGSGELLLDAAPVSRKSQLKVMLWKDLVQKRRR